MENQRHSKTQVPSWYKHYPKDVPHKITLDYDASLVDLFEHAVEAYSQLPAFECMGTTITYETLDERSRNFAAYLQNELQLNRGTRIAIQLPNVLQYPIALFGALRAGMVVVNTNPLYTSREMKHQFKDSEAEVVVILANFAHNLEKILPGTFVRHVIITQIGDQLQGIKKIVVNGTIKYIKKMVTNYHLPMTVSFNEVIKEGGRQTFQRVSPRGNDTAFLQYTGGTTGVSKGAMLSHTNLVANVEQFLTWFGGTLRTGGETIITAMPLYHIMALMGNCLTMMKIGAKNVLITNPRNMKGFIKELRKNSFSFISGVNTLFNGLLNQPDFETVDFSNLKFCGAGGMAIQTTVAEHWKSKTGVPITEGYGLTETSPILTFNITISGKERIGTIGLPMPNTEIMIVNNDGQEVPHGTPGEIYARGPQVMKGYYNHPEETEKVFTWDGWFKTGDIGIRDEDGFFRIVDRKKEMILVSGFNVYPNEIEDVVSSHKKVLEVGAVGVADERSTESVKIFVVKKDPSLTKEELLAYCKENLTAYKVPKHVEFRDELPKSNVGKILRRLLKE